MEDVTDEGKNIKDATDEGKNMDDITVCFSGKNTDAAFVGV